MPLQDHMKLSSTDDHVIEHAAVWLDRLPAKDHETAPRIVEVDPRGEGDDSAPFGPAQVWLYEGRRYLQMALHAVAGRRREDFGLEPTRYDQILPGCYDPIARVKDMDDDGIRAQLCFHRMLAPSPGTRWSVRSNSSSGGWPSRQRRNCDPARTSPGPPAAPGPPPAHRGAPVRPTDKGDDRLRRRSVPDHATRTEDHPAEVVKPGVRRLQ
jgi:hypothetical protein